MAFHQSDGIKCKLVSADHTTTSPLTEKLPFDDTKRYVDNTPNLSAADKQKVFEGNALKVYPRLKAQIEKQARG